MPMHAQLEDEHGQVREERGGDPNVLPLLLPAQDEADFPLLRYVDEYGDTVFNSTQAQAVLKEWDAVRERATSESEIRSWESVRALLERAASSPHQYVRFVGD